MQSPDGRPTRSRPPAVHEYVNGAAPYALEAPETGQPTTDTPVTAPAGHSIAMPSLPSRTPAATGLRSLFAIGLALSLLVAFGVSSAFSGEPRKLLAKDSFDRALASADWGHTTTGDRWMYPTGRDGMAVVGGRGAMTLPRRGAVRMNTINTTVRDVSMLFEFSVDQTANSSGVKVMSVLRKTDVGSYRARVRIGQGGRVWLSLVKVRGARQGTTLGRAHLIEGWRYKEGQHVNVKAQAIGKQPTQLRVKAWPTSGAEPSGWQLVRNDGNDDIGGLGRVGLRAMLTGNAASRSARVRFDELTVNRAQDAGRVAVTPNRQNSKKAEPKTPKKSDPETPEETKPKETDPPKATPTPTPVPEDVPELPGPPVISHVQVSEVGMNSAVVAWDAGEPATGQVQYGPTAEYGYSTTKEASFDYTAHQQQLSGLDPDQRYHIRVVSEDRDGNRVVSDNYVFQTATAPEPTATPAPKPTATPAPKPTATPAPKPTATPAPKPTATPEQPDPAPTIRSVEIEDLGVDSATIAWEATEPVTGQVEYGPTTDYGYLSTKEQSFDYSAHRQQLSGLDPDRRYHIRVISEDRDGNRVVSSDYTFRTAAAPTPTATPAPKPTATPAPKPTATPAPKPTATPAPPPAPAPASGEMYGSGVAMTSLWNTTLPGSRRGALRFEAKRNGSLSSVRWYVQTGSGYAAGGNWRYELQVQGDSGGVPNGTVVGTTGAQSVQSGAGFKMQFTSRPKLEKGRKYHLVWINRHSNPSGNYVSVNSVAPWDKVASPAHPMYTNGAVTFKYKDGGSWINRPGHAVVHDFTYADGSHQGMGYIEISYNGLETGKIAGSASVRERFTVSGSDRKVSTFGIRLQRVSGSGNLVVRLEDASGNLLRRGTVAASKVPAGSLTRLPEASDWVSGSFESPITLKSGTTYNLHFKTASGTHYATWVIRKGTDYGYSPTTYFSDGVSQYSTGGGWSSLGRRSGQNDLQFYLR